MIICADDFGISNGVSEGIIELVFMDRVSAVSCMINYNEKFHTKYLEIKNEIDEK